MQTRLIHLYGGPLDGMEIDVPTHAGNFTHSDGSRYTITNHSRIHGVAIYAYTGTERSLKAGKERAS